MPGRQSIVMADFLIHYIGMNSSRLAGPPSRVSPAPSASWGRTHHGHIKVRLCHGLGRSYLLPDVLIGFDGRRFFMPSFFGAPQLAFGIPSTNASFGPLHHEATLELDFAAPRATSTTRVVVSFRSDGFVRSYEDGAQLYRCSYRAPLASRLSEQVAGKCKKLPNDDFAIDLYHHTTPKNAALIGSSEELWSSPRNLAGTADLANVSYLYFTTLPSIENEQDLLRVAMSSTSKIAFQTTSDRQQEQVVVLPVYEGRLDERGAALKFVVPLEIVAPVHLLFHPRTTEEPAYYEVAGQEIVRVEVRPNVVGKILEGQIHVEAEALKRFGTVIEGDASGTDGLVEPMDEAGSTTIAHIESLNKGLDLFEFWKESANTDLYSNRKYEERVFRD